MALKWERQERCMLSSIRDEMETVCVSKLDPDKSPKCALIIMMQWEELMYPFSICDVQYNKKTDEILPEDPPPRVRFDSFQLICNFQ
jgi:hypothetical protein